MHVPTRDFGKSRSRVHLDLETEMPGVELDRAIHVVYDIAEARGHGSFLSFLGLACRSRTYPYRSETSTSHYMFATPTKLQNCHATAAFGRLRTGSGT